jgi:hypothetical protein
MASAATAVEIVLSDELRQVSVVAGDSVFLYVSLMGHFKLFSNRSAKFSEEIYLTESPRYLVAPRDDLVERARVL